MDQLKSKCDKKVSVEVMCDNDFKIMLSNYEFI